MGNDGYSIVVHGKASHEETRATFSHSAENAAVIIVENIDEAKLLGEFIKGNLSIEEFNVVFKNRTSKGFNPSIDLKNIGVVNQTTMLATDTIEISDYLKNVISSIEENSFADTRDTLCYATLDNQNAVNGMLETNGDIAFVVGGYNSSNTSHLVELCSEKLTTYFINSADCINASYIECYDLQSQKTIIQNTNITTFKKIMITSGASCPDSIVDAVIEKIISLFPNKKPLKDVLATAIS